MRISARLFVVLASLLWFSACSLQNMDQRDGVIWDTYTEAPVTCGIEMKDNNIFFADSFGNIYSVWIDSGSTRWKRTLVSETVTGLYPGNNLVAVSTGSVRTSIRYYSFDDGNIVFQTNLDLVVKDTFLADSNKLVLHTASKLVVFDLGDGHSDIFDYSVFLNLNGIRSVVKGSGCYYVITELSRVLRLNDQFGVQTVYSDFEGELFFGPAVYLNNSLYVSGQTGMRIIPSMGRPYHSGMIWKNAYTPMTVVGDEFHSVIYMGMSGAQRNGIGRFSQTISDLAEDWYRQSFASVTYSPVAYSDTLSVVATVDDAGLLDIFDATTGKFIYSKYIGIINQPGLKFKNDYYSKSVFIPVSSPAKIVCYSLYYAVNRQKY